MDEMAEPTLFENQNIVPAQFFSGRRDGARMEPFRRLALAVLVDAVHIFQTKFDASQPSRRREFKLRPTSKAKPSVSAGRSRLCARPGGCLNPGLGLRATRSDTN